MFPYFLYYLQKGCNCVDVLLHNVGSECEKTSTIQDVFNEGEQDNLTEVDPNTNVNAVVAYEDHEEQISEQNMNAANIDSDVVHIEELKRIYTAPAIDVQAGTYRSKGT